MQANQAEVLEQIHKTLESNIEKMYSRVDSIIESAKSFVSQNPEQGDEVVENITNYTKYMHDVIDKIVDLYKSFTENEQANLQEFKDNVAILITKAKTATAKAQELLK